VGPALTEEKSDEMEETTKTILGLTPFAEAKSALTCTTNGLLRETHSYSRTLRWPDPPGRGRPPVWSKFKLQQTILRTVQMFEKRRYRTPTLRETAAAIGERQPMTEAALKKLLQRYGLKWSELKRKTET
jgi:hypothetical protein